MPQALNIIRQEESSLVAPLSEIPKRMKALRYYGLHDARLETIDVSRPGPTDILIKVKKTGICATDRKILTDPFMAGTVYGAPFTMGHESAGEVVELGKDFRGEADGIPLHEGDLVAVQCGEWCGECYFCRRGLSNLCLNLRWRGFDHRADGGMAEYLKASNLSTHKVLEGLTLREAAMIEPASIAIHAVRRADPKLGHVIFIYGAGFIGLCILQIVRALGARKVIVSEISEVRRDMCKKLGADLVINPKTDDTLAAVREATEGLGTDVVFEVVGSAALIEQAIDITKRRGTILLVGNPEYGDKIASRQFFKVVHNELNILGSTDYSHWPGRSHDYKESMHLIKAGKLSVDQLVTQEFTLDQYKEAFDVASSPEKSIKAAFTF